MENILEKFKSKSLRSKIKTSSMINPHKHWINLMWGFLTIIIILTVLSIYLLYKIKNEQIFQVAPTITDNSATLKESILKEVIGSFDEKAGKEKEIKTKTAPYIDPSL